MPTLSSAPLLLSEETAAAGRVEPLALLLVEDSPADSRLLQEQLREVIASGEVLLQVSRSLADAQRAVARMAYSAALVDLGLPDGQGLAVVEGLRALDPNMAIVVLTGQDSPDLARETLRLGGQDYVVKGRLDGMQMLRSLRFAVQRHRQLRQLRLQLPEHFHDVTRDAATGLPNRGLFEDRGRQVLALAERMNLQAGLLYFGFELQAPDGAAEPLSLNAALLRTVGQALEESVRIPDTVAYLGQGEFAALLVATDDLFDAGVVARRCHERMRLLDAAPGKLVCSIGLVVFPHHGSTLAALVDNGEQAMFRARRAGGGISVWTPPVSTSLDPTALSLSGANAALRIEPMYQPWFSLPDGRCAGLEALLPARDAAAWREASAEHRRVGGYYLIERLCLNLRTWRNAGISLPALSLYLESEILRQPDLLPFLLSQLEATDLQPKDLQLEVPATVFTGRSLDRLDWLSALREHGFPIVIDPFQTDGKGFVPLAALLLDGLRIGGDVIAALASDSRASSARRLISATLGAAAGLGIEVIASGVECAEARIALQSLGVRYLQGDQLCAPMTAAELAQRWRDQPLVPAPR